jgi:hypothetical protein
VRNILHDRRDSDSGQGQTVSTEAIEGPAAPAPLNVRDLARSLDRFDLATWMIVAAQAIWLGVLMSRGWYYQADLANLAQATGRPLSWAYLSGPQGGHFAVPGRFLFWVLNRTAPLNYPVTIVIRLVGQAASTVLLARLLVLLVGRRRTVLLALALYSFSPFLIQGTLWLSASFGLVGSQLLLLGALFSHVHYAVSRRLVHAIATSGFVLAATLLSEEAAVTVLALPILSLGYLTSGTASERVRATMTYWREWLLIAVPMVGYVLYYFSGSGGYGVAAHPLSAGDAARVIGVELSNTIAPGLIGGPWRWFSAGDNYLGLATPSPMIQTLSTLAVLAAIGLCVRQQGWRALAAWSMPAVIAAVGIVVVAVGRYDAFGVVIAQQFEHAYYAALPAALAVCLGFCGLDINAVRARLHQVADDSATAISPRPTPNRAVVAGVATTLVISSLVSGVTYTQLWSRSPARSYVTTLETSLRTAGPDPALYDTSVPTRLIPLESAHYVSDVIGLTDAGADFGYAAARPKIVDSDGHIVPARFFVQTDVDLTQPRFCRFPVQGAVTVTKPLRATPRRNDWYLQISYFEQHASVINVTVIDSDGTARSPESGARVLLHGGPGGVHLLLRGTSPVAIRIQSLSPSTNLCIAGAKIGFPFAVKPGS